MDYKILIFALSVFAIEFLCFYAPMYIVTYEGLKLNKNIGDSKLALILFVISAIASILCFPYASDLIIRNLF